ncbi:MAG: alanine--tRNA ligase [Candidatus Syntropharchaeia archaeon]
MEYDLDYFIKGGFIRKKCEKCGSYFWSRDKKRKTCGDAPCDPYSFIGKPVFKPREMDDMREFFLSFFEKRGHKRIERYPVVARWRDDIYLTIASIADFQPFVTSGKVPPPANPLVISQPCIRLDDLDSVGRSGRHLTTFEMMAHHAFNKKGEEIYWKEETVEYCDELLTELGADPMHVTYKEAPWAGGGNAGPCLEVIIGGLEIATLVFMDLELREDGDVVIKGERYAKMDNYIVDTGYGLERFVWASKGSPTIYDAIFPDIVNELMSIAGIEHSLEDPEYARILAQHARLAGMMDVSGKKNIDRLRKEVAKIIGIPVEELKKIAEPVEAVYAIADHSRCLAYMLGDGIIPSNMKAGYLARLVLRKTLRMMGELGLEVPLSDIVTLQIKKLREFEDKIDRIREIIDLEEKRYDSTLKKGKRLVKKISQEYKKKNESIPLKEMIWLYDTHGIPPEIARGVAGEIGVEVEYPDNFYSLVAQSHARAEVGKEKSPYMERVKNLPKTKKLYYDNPEGTRFEAVVLDSFDHWVVLDQTLFYPEGGGQPADSGTIATEERIFRVIDVKSVDDVIIHRVEGEIQKGEVVEGVIDFERRKAHSKHHSATHIVLDSAKKVLGDHIWQAGAQKGVDRARLDISHFKRITPSEREEIEMIANQTVMKNIKIITSWMDRTEAEKKYGPTLYQGGVPPGEKIRVVKIGDDVEACAGTHCTTTGKIGVIKILNTERIQDGIERIEFSAGEAAIKHIQEKERLLNKSANVLRVPPEILPETAKRFFEEWKSLKKENERLKESLSEINVEKLLRNVKNVNGVSFVAEKVNLDVGEMIKCASLISEKDAAALLINESGRSVVSLPLEMVKRGKDAREIVKEMSEILGGSGGGKPELAQGGGPNTDRIREALNRGTEIIIS